MNSDAHAVLRRARPLLILVAAPSGAGKTTLCERLLREFPEIRYSVSCTTRPPRPGERDGVHYHFLSPDAFERRVRDGAFLEHAVVHGARYGTLRATVEDALRGGSHVLLAIDVQGGRAVRTQVTAAPPGGILNRSLVDVFVAPPSMQALRERLEARGKDSPRTIETRLRNAAEEMRCAPEFRHRVVNDDLAAAYAELRSIILREAAAVPGRPAGGDRP